MLDLGVMFSENIQMIGLTNDLGRDKIEFCFLFSMLEMGKLEFSSSVYAESNCLISFIWTKEE